MFKEEGSNLFVVLDDGAWLTLPKTIASPLNSAIVIDSRSFLERYAKPIEWVIKHNVNNGAYHTTHHLIGVAWLCYVLLRMGPARSGVDDLVMAGLFHDYCHPVNNDDAINIETTLAAMTRDGVFRLNVSCEVLPVFELIKQTQWPLPDGLEITTLGNVLRDADQLYASYFFNAEMSRRLFDEMGPRFGIDTYAAWLKRNTEYVFSLRGTFSTQLADRLFEQALDNVITVQTDELIALI